MGHISLPSLDDIVQEKDPRKQSEMLLNTVGILIKNLSELNGYLTSKNIRASSIEADRLNVDQLSAISANLGHITAGLIEAVNIYASFFATSQGSYPRVEIDPSGSYVRVYKDANNYMRISPGISGTPLLEFYVGGSQTAVYGAAGSTGVIQGKNLLVSVDGEIQLSPGTGKVKVPAWSYLYNDLASQTLQEALDDLDARITALGG